MCFGVTTRYFVIKKLRDGGEHYSCEIKIRDKFKEAMESLGLWDKVNVLGDSMFCDWDKKIDFLFIDSEHGLSDALGEYMRYRRFLSDQAIVGFHDTDICWGVNKAIEVIQQIDDLELISEASNKASAGIKFFKVIGLNIAQSRINQQKRDEEARIIHETQERTQ